MNHVLIIENNVQESDINTIREFFENYQLAKISDIEYNSDTLSAVINLDYWYKTRSALNLYERIQDYGVANIVYDDPQYFTVKFYDDQYDKMDKYNHDQDKLEQHPIKDNEVDNSDQEDEDEDEHEYEDEVDDRDEYIARENSVYDYLEDDVIENSSNIEKMFRMIEELQLQISTSNKNLTLLNRRVKNIRRTTSYLSKNSVMKPVTKRSIWKSRLRPRQH